MEYTPAVTAMPAHRHVFVAILLLLPAAAARAEAPETAREPRRIALRVTEKGFEPSPVKVKKGEPLELVVTRKTDDTCATSIVVPGYDVRADLPLGEPVSVRFTPAKSGKLRYGCGMYQMISGVLLVE